MVITISRLKQLFRLFSSEHPPMVFKRVVRHWGDYRTMLVTIPKWFKNAPYYLSPNDEVIVIVIPTGVKTTKYTTTKTKKYKITRTKRPPHDQKEEEAHESRNCVEIETGE